MNTLQKREDYLVELPDSWDANVSLLENSMSIAMKTSLSTFWFTGRIVEHLQEIHGNGTIPKLSDETGYSQRSLYYMQNIYQSFPDYEDIELLAESKISWTGVKELSRLDDDQRTEAFALIKSNDLTDSTINQYVEDALKGDDTPQIPAPGGCDAAETGTGDTGGSGQTNLGTNPKDNLEKTLTWIQKLHKNLVQTRADMEVPLTDISEKIDSLDEEDGTDPAYVLCVAELDETIKDITRFISYLTQVADLLER
jgi:hypothetical protein